MKKLLAIAFSIGLTAASFRSHAAAAQEQQQPKQKTVVQTPFGPKEIEVEPGQAAAPAPAQAAPQTPAAGAPTSINATPAAPVTPPAGPPLAQPSPGAQAGAQVGAEPADVKLTLDNQDIHAIIKIILDTLGASYIIDPEIKGTVNLHTSDALRRSDLLPILETILRVNGATLVRTGGFYHIIPATSAPREPLAIEERGAAVAPDDQMIMQIIRMKFVAAGEMSRLLSPFLTDGANIVVHETGNILLITERRSNLRKLFEVIDIFDTSTFEGERVRLYPVKNNFAKDLIGDLKAIFAGYALSENATAIRFVSIDRMNSVLVITPNATVFPEVEKWLDRIDQPLATAGVRNFVYRVKNAKASDIQRVISELYGSRAQLPPAAQQPAGTPAGPPQQQPQPASPFSTPAGAAAQPSQSGTGVIQTGPLKIIADETQNALVVQATPQLYADVLRTIEELDVLPRQVLVDAQIYEVTLDDSISLGLNAILQNRGTLTNLQTTASFVTPAGGTPSVIGQTFAFAGRSRELQLFLNATENRSRVRTLSAPSVLVSDNMTADFQVGAEVPVPTSSAVAAGVQAGGNSVFTQTISFRPTGVLLRVKPQINSSGNVTLEISQEVSQAGANTTSGVVAPVIGKSAINSTVVVQDGQTIALGGFIRENNELARARVPFLGRIPVAGILFGNTRRATTRTELIVLITPHVLQNHEDADLATNELKAKLKEVQKLLR